MFLKFSRKNSFKNVLAMAENLTGLKLTYSFILSEKLPVVIFKLLFLIQEEKESLIKSTVALRLLIDF